MAAALLDGKLERRVAKKQKPNKAKNKKKSDDLFGPNLTANGGGANR